MRVIQVFPGRISYYDRNPSNPTLQVSLTGEAPHTWTLRATYTVPSGRKAFIDLISTVIARRTEATTAGVPAVIIEYTPAGGTGIYIVYERLQSSLVGAAVSAYVPQAGILLPGDKIDIYTIDESTGGTVDYYIAVKMTEFNA